MVISWCDNRSLQPWLLPASESFPQKGGGGRQVRYCLRNRGNSGRGGSANKRLPRLVWSERNNMEFSLKYVLIDIEGCLNFISIDSQLIIYCHIVCKLMDFVIGPLESGKAKSSSKKYISSVSLELH